MRIVASVQAKRNSSRGLVHYVARSKLDIEREPEKGRELFNDFTDNLTVESANNSLKMGIAKARPSNDELSHLVLSFRPSDYQALGRDEKARRRALKEVTRAAMTRLETALSAERLSWAAAVHLNTENPHVHIALQKEYFTQEIERQILTRIPREALPHFEHRGDEKVLVPGFLIEAATERIEKLIAHVREQLLVNQKDGARKGPGISPSPNGMEREADGDALQNTTREREILRHGFLAEYELHRVDTKITDLIERGDTMRFLVSDPKSGIRRRVSLRDVKEHETSSDTGPKSPPEVQIRTILSKMLAKGETAKVKLQNDTADARRETNRVKARYRQNGWKLPSPSFTKNELDKVQNHYLQASDLRRFTYLEGVRSELERSGEIGPRDKESIGRIAAEKLISDLRGKVHLKNYLDLSERRYYSLAAIRGKGISLAQLDREENASVNPVVRLVQHLKKSVSRLSEPASTSQVEIENDRIRDEIVGKLEERLAGIERDRKSEQKKAKILEKILTVESGEPAGGEPVYSAEQLAEIDSLSSRLKLRAIYENNRDKQRKLIESAESDCPVYRIALKNDPSADFEEYKRTVIAGRALAREIVAKVEFGRAKDDLKTFSESKRFHRFAIADKDTGSLSFLSLQDVDLPRRNSILDRAVDEIFESREHRSLRRTVTSLVKAREQRLKDDFNGARGILASASREASEFTHSSLFGLSSEPMYRPIFTPSEITAIEMRAATTADPKEAARMRKVLESTADQPQRSLKDFLRDFESPSMSHAKNREYDPSVPKISDRIDPVGPEQVSGKHEKLKEPKFFGHSR